MPRSTKEVIQLENKPKKKSASTAKKTSATKASKKAVNKTVKAKSSKSNTIKTTTSKKTSIKTNANKKKSSVVNNKKKSTKTKTSSKSNSNILIEYYDLPYRYDKTVVKILAQTPNRLFVYWDISNKDKKALSETYGKNFFENTKPILLIRNITMNYTFEVDINDLANSWYLNINDSDCKYSIELGRRPKQYNSGINTDYIYIASSNNIEAPNDHILFDNNQNMVYFRNVKTNITIAKHLTSLSFITNMGRIYNIYDLYKKMYINENLHLLENPSSSFFK